MTFPTFRAHCDHIESIDDGFETDLTPKDKDNKPVLPTLSLSLCADCRSFVVANLHVGIELLFEDLFEANPSMYEAVQVQADEWKASRGAQ